MAVAQPPPAPAVPGTLSPIVLRPPARNPERETSQAAGPEAFASAETNAQTTPSSHTDFADMFSLSPRDLNGIPSQPVRGHPVSAGSAPAAYGPQLAALATGPAYWPGLCDGRTAERVVTRSLGWRRAIARAWKYMMVGAAAWFAAVFLLIAAYRVVDPPMSALMLQRTITGESVAQTWVPIAAISPRLVRAVLVSEDGRFCQHWGLDFEAIEAAIARSADGSPRGASTISMQVAKNLFLWPSKSYVRKVLEVPLTLGIEALWSKKRIMEVYLNVAEWGPGIFGAEQAARHHFGKSALRLNDREAARLAVSLPNPIHRDAGHPGPGARRLAALNIARSRGAPAAVTGCVLGREAAD